MSRGRRGQGEETAISAQPTREDSDATPLSQSSIPMREEDDANMSDESWDIIYPSDDEESLGELLDSDAANWRERLVLESKEESSNSTQSQTSSPEALRQMSSSSKRSRKAGFSAKTAEMGNVTSAESERSAEDGGDENHYFGTEDCGTQSTPSQETPDAASDDLSAKVDALESALSKQLLESKETQSKLIESLDNISKLHKCVDEMNADAKATQAKLDQEASLRTDMQTKLDAAISAAVTSVLKQYSNAVNLLGTKVSELEGHQETLEAERSSLRTVIDEGVDSLSTRFDKIETELRKRQTTSEAHVASRNVVQEENLEALESLEAQIRRAGADAQTNHRSVFERLDRIETAGQAREKQMRESTEQQLELKEQLKQLDDHDNACDKQADILMKHSEKNWKRSKQIIKQIDELRKAHEEDQPHISGLFKEHDTQLRLLQDAVKNCERHLKIRPQPSQPKVVSDSPGEGPSNTGGILGGPLSADKGFLNPAWPPSETPKTDNPAPAEPFRALREPIFRPPLPIVDPRHGNGINPELVLEMNWAVEHRRRFPDGCYDPTCYECRHQRRPR